jgi:conjugal transfer pilus assembly protein TraL
MSTEHASMTDARLAIPQHLDDPPRFLFWDLDEAMLFMLALIAGMLMQTLFIGIAVGIVLVLLYGKAKSGRHRAFAIHLMYWYLPVGLGFKRTPPSYIREYIR